MERARHGIVADGAERNQEPCVQARVRAEIEACYAARLASATERQAQHLLAQLEAEVQARLAEISERTNLY